MRGLSGSSLALLASILCVVLAEADEKSYSCEQIDAVPAPDRCNFVIEECDTGEKLKTMWKPSVLLEHPCLAGGRIPFLPLYYCHVEPAGIVAKISYMVSQPPLKRQGE